MPDRELALDRLADDADDVSKTMHAAIRQVDDLADRLLAIIEDVGGDREYNYALYADLKYLIYAVHSIHTKAQTVSRHARAAAREKVAP